MFRGPRRGQVFGDFPAVLHGSLGAIIGLESVSRYVRGGFPASSWAVISTDRPQKARGPISALKEDGEPSCSFGSVVHDIAG
jgi:hypothetical protein